MSTRGEAHERRASQTAWSRVDRGVRARVRRPPPWRKAAAIPLSGAILAVGLGLGQFRAARDTARSQAIADNTALRAVSSVNVGETREERLEETIRADEALGDADRARLEGEARRARGLRLLACAAFLGALALWCRGRAAPTSASRD